MKRIYSLTKLSLAFSVILLNACTSGFDELNTNPSIVTKEVMKPEMLLTSVLKNSIFEVHGSGSIHEWAGYYSNPATAPLSNRNWADPFMAHYRNYVLNISEAVRLSEREPLRANQHAIARIWRVWVFHQLTDAYGDIPYFQSGLDVEDAVNAPAYDSQESIYQDLLSELKVTAAMLSDDPNMISYGAADILFQGNVEKWRRFANSLRLRLAMRVRYASPDLAKEHILEVISEPLIDSNEFNAALTTEGEGAANVNNRNPFYNRSISNTVPLYASLTTSENLLERNDPRLEIYITPAPEPQDGALWRGRPLAVDLEQEEGWSGSGYYAQEHIASVGSYFLKPVYRIMVLNAAEVSFLRAEAALAGFTSEDSEALLKDGVRKSLEYYNVNSTQIEAYLKSDFLTLDGSEEEQLEEIIVQKWLANYYQGNESWAEYRRTGYPLIWVGKQSNDTGQTIPRRMTYPDDEYFKNEANVRSAVERMGNGDSYASRVWWDKKPGLPFSHPRQGQFPPDVF